jgi:xanthine dehydrogenase YagR molybdenum-binding subunit
MSPPVTREDSSITRRDVLVGTAALGSLRCAGSAVAGEAPSAAAIGQPLAQASRLMTPTIGTRTSRVDGRAKVTGAAKYAGDFNSAGMAYGYVVESTIAKGRITRLDTSAAMRVDGAIAVLTHANRPRMADTDAAYKDDVAPEKGSPFRPLYDDKILFNGQPIALVLAEEWEIARFAASLVRVEYDKAEHVTDLHAQRAHAYVVEKPEKSRGDAATAYGAAAVKHVGEYFIPIEHHNPMELYASTAAWDGDGKLTVYDKTQGVQNVQRYLCGVFEMKSDALRVVSPFVGGAFGSGLRPNYQAVLAVLGALALKRPVRLVLTRQQMYGLGYRPASIETLAIGAAADGSLASISHEAIAMTSQYEEFSRNDTAWSALLYKSANANYVHKLVGLDAPTSCDMRGPGAATGVYALECAMDELAVALKLDPVTLRLQCYSERDQNTDLPYTSKELRACYRQGAESFGWSKRNAEPRSMREGKELVGWGMATGVWEALQMPAAARITLTADGHAEIACATSDIGTGTYTIMAQVAADMLGLPIESITIKLGDSTLPQSPVEGGSWIAASVSHAIVSTAEAIREELLRLAKAVPQSPLATATLEDTVLADGKIVSRKDPSQAVSLADAMRQGDLDRIVQEKTNGFKSAFEGGGDHAHNTHSAIFAEVRVDEEIGVIRVTRVVEAVASGRILNAKTAHSQIMGSVVWGIGMALHEETVVDHRYGRIMNANIAEYHVPVNADIQEIEVIFVDERDAIINPLGVKGLGEIGIIGVAAAIANAVYHATGKRVRDLPITIDKLRR